MNLKVITIITLLMHLLGCIDDSKSSSDSITTVENIDLLGKWKSSCYQGFVIGTNQCPNQNGNYSVYEERTYHGDNSYLRHSEIYCSIDCSGDIVRETDLSGTYEVGPESADESGVIVNELNHNFNDSDRILPDIFYATEGKIYFKNESFEYVIMSKEVIDYNVPYSKVE